MAHQFNDEEKEVREFSDSMPFGITVVQVTGAIADVNQNDKEFIEVGVIAENGVEDSAKFWFTGGASNISFNNLRTIAVHCAETDELKEKARQAVDKVADSQELADLISDICTGKKVWFTKYYDAKGATFTNEYGTFKSTNKNVLGYEPKLREDLMPKKTEDTPFGPATPAEQAEPTNAADTVPGDWAK